jgi:hypothetical protein
VKQILHRLPTPVVGKLRFVGDQVAAHTFQSKIMSTAAVKFTLV